MNLRKISIDDVIFATVIRNGMKIASMTLSGMGSIVDLLAAVSSRVGIVTGLVTLKLRNYTQGWADTRSMMLTRPVMG